MAVSLTEFNEERYAEVLKEEGFAEGLKEGRAKEIIASGKEMG